MTFTADDSGGAGSDLCGVFIIRNKASDSFVALHSDRTGDGTKVHGWTSPQSSKWTLDQNWLIEKIQGKEHYTVRNVLSNTCLDLDSGRSANGTKVQGWEKNNSDTQHWYIRGDDQTGYRFINVAAGTVLDLSFGDKADGTKMQCVQNLGGDNQIWYLDRRFRSFGEIDSLLKASPNINCPVNHFLSHTNYITLPEEIIQSIWRDKRVGSRKLRSETYDRDDFSFAMKTAIGEWCHDNIRAPVAIVFGIVYGINPEGTGHAYNWYLSHDLSRIVTFDPQTGKSDPITQYNAYFGIY